MAKKKRENCIIGTAAKCGASVECKGCGFDIKEADRRMELLDNGKGTVKLNGLFTLVVSRENV